MAIQSLPGGAWFPVYPMGQHNNPAHASGGGYTANGLNEYLAIVGEISLSGGRGSGPVTMDTASKIWFRTGGVTFANASSNLRIGVQDVSVTTGLPDTTFDCYADLVPGTDTLSSNTITSVLMETGSKAISDGDMIALVLQWTAYAGADSLQINTNNTGRSVHPYGAADTGGGAGKNIDGAIRVEIDFEGDGTVMGYFTASRVINGANVSFNSGSTPDEYGLLFRVPFPAQICGADLGLYSIGSDFEMIIYSDPLGTPVAEKTRTVDKDIESDSDTWSGWNWTSTYNLAANTDYCLAIRPTSASNVTLLYVDVGSGNTRLLLGNPFGTDGTLATRTNNTGAFTETNYQVPVIAPRFCGFDDGTATGSGMIVHPGMQGGCSG